MLVGAYSRLRSASFLPYRNDIVVLGDTAIYHHTGFSYWFVAVLSPHLAFFSLMTFGEVWFLLLLTFSMEFAWLFLFSLITFFMTFGEVS